jgi:hypothetical protein
LAARHQTLFADAASAILNRFPQPFRVGYEHRIGQRPPEEGNQILVFKGSRIDQSVINAEALPAINDQAGSF